MASRHEIISIDFRANAAKANPAMDALRESAKNMRTEVEKTKTAISDGIKTGKSQEELDKLGAKLRTQERELKSFETAMNTLAKGVTTLSRAIDAFNTGTLDQMSAAFQKASYNAAETAKKALLPGTKDYQKNMMELDALQQKNLENLAKYKLRTEQMLQSIGKEGSKISSQDLKQEADGIQELMRLLPHMSHEWLEYNDILKQVNAAIKQQTDDEKRLTGAIVDANDARERSSQLSRKGVEEAARQRKEAEEEVKQRTENIAALKEERAEKAKQVSIDAANAIAKDKEVEKQRKVVAAIQDRIDNEKRDAERKQKNIDKLNQEAEAYDKTAKSFREAAKTMKTEVKGIDDELKQVNEELAKMGGAAPAVPKNPVLEGIKQGAEEAKQEVSELITEQEKLTQMQKVLKEKMIAAFGNAAADKNPDDVDIIAALNRSAKTGRNTHWTAAFSREHKSPQELAEEFLNARKIDTWIGDDGKQVSSDATDIQNKIKDAKEYLRVELRNLLYDSAPMDELKKFADEWNKALSANGEALRKSLAVDDLSYMDNLIQKAIALKEVQVQRAEVAKQSSVVTRLKVESEVTGEVADKNVEASKQTAAAKEKEVKAGETAAKAAENEKVTVESLIKRNDELKIRIAALNEERKQMLATQEKNAAAVKEEANAYKDLSKEQAQAMLDQKQQLATFKKEGEKWQIGNREEAQRYLFDALGEINPANVGKTTMSIESSPEKISQLLGKFQERYGIEGEGEAMAAVRELMSGGGLVKSGFMNKFFMNVEANVPKVAAYSKEIKDLTAVINGEVKAVEEDTEKKRTLADVEAELEAAEKESRDISIQAMKMRNGQADATEGLTQKERIATIKAETEAVRQMSQEEVKAALEEAKKVSTVGYKAGKLHMSDPEEVQQFLIGKMRTIGKIKNDNGSLSLAGSQVDALVSAFQQRYGWKDDKTNAKALLKKILQGKDGMFMGGDVDLSADVGSVHIQYVKDIYDARIEKAKALVDVSKGVKQATYEVSDATRRGADAAKDATEATKGQTDAIKAQEAEVMRRKAALDKMNGEYEQAEKKLKDMRRRYASLPSSGADAALAKAQLKDEIDDYNENVVKKARADKNRLKKLWEQSVKDLTAMMGVSAEDSKKSADAQNQENAAIERGNKGRGRKKKAVEDATQAVKEEANAEGDAAKQGEQLSEQDRKRIALEQKKQELETKRGQKIDEITKKEEDAAAAEVRANNNRSEARQMTEELSQAHGKNADAMGKATDEMKKLEFEQDGLNKKADEGRKALAEYDQKIDDNAEKRLEAQKKQAQAQRLTIDTMTEAIKVLEARNRAIEPESEEWVKNARLIRQYQAELDRLKQQPVLDMMTQRMGNIRNLSADALQETKKFWQGMITGAEHGSTKLKEYERNLEKVAKEEEKRRQEIQAPMRKRLNNLEKLSTADLAETKRYWETVRDGVSQTSAAYKKAELAVKSLTNEENRRKANAQAQHINDLMRDLNNLSTAGLTEVKRYWQAMADGARKGTDEAKDAEAALKRINEIEDQRHKASIRRQARSILTNQENMSEEELRRGIAAAKEYMQTFKVGGQIRQMYNQAIARGEDLLKKFSVEQERAKQQEIELKKTMQDRMASLSALSTDALAETKKYWEVQYAGAERSSQAFKDAEQNLKRINEQEQTRKAGQATRVLSNMGDYGDAEIKQAVQTMEQLRDAQAHGSAQWELYNKRVEEGKRHLDEWASIDKVMKFEGQMQNVTTLSDAALQETKKFWETMVAGAEKGSSELRDYEQHLERVKQEEQERRQLNDEITAGRLNGDLLNFSTGEIDEAIKAGERLVATYKSGEPEAVKLAEKIAAAKEYIKTFGEETSKVAKNQVAEVEGMAALEKAQNGEYATASMDQLEIAIKRIKEYQTLIKDPKGEGAKTFADAKEQIELLTAQLDALKGKTDKAKAAFENADEVMQRFSEHMKGTVVTTPGQSIDEQLSQHVSMYDGYIKDAAESTDFWEQQVKEATAELDKMEKELAELEKKHANSSWFRKQTSEYKREGWRIESLKKDINGETFADGTVWGGQKEQVEHATEMRDSYQQNLDYYKQQKAEELGLVEVEEQVQKARRMTREEMQEGIKVLEAEAMAQDRSTADGQKRWEELRKTIGEMNQELKEATGEWMKLADAQKIAEGAGKKGFAASAQEIQQATQALERRREELIKQIRAERDLGNAVDAQEKELDDLTKKLRSLKFEQDNVNMSQEKMRTLIETPANAVNLDELRAAIKRADGQLRQMQQSLGQNSDEYKRFAEQVRNAKNVMKEMEGQAKASATAWEKAFSRLKTYVVMYMGFNEVWQKVSNTARDLMDLSDRMGEVRKTTGFTADEVGRLSENLKKMDVRTSLTSLMEISASAGQLGLKTLEDVQGFTEAANKLMIALPEMGREAATEMMRVAIATGEVDKIRKQLQEGTIEGSSATAVAMEKIASTIDRLRASSASTAPEITDFVKRVGAVGAQSGITIDQVAALGSTVSSLGMRIEMSATALSRMIPAIRNNAFELAKAIGVTPDTIRNLFDTGRGMEVILMILQRIKDTGMDADSVEQMLGMAGMRDIMKDLNQQGARAGIVFSGLSQNVDELRRQLGVASEAYEENIAIQQEFDKMNETTAAKWERLKNQFEEMFVGDEAQQWLGKIIDGARVAVDIIEALQGYIVRIAAAFALWKTGVGGAIWTYLINPIRLALTGVHSLNFQVKGLAATWRTAWKSMDAATKTNWIVALGSAIFMLGKYIYDTANRVSELDQALNELQHEESNNEHILNRLVTTFNNVSAKAAEATKKHDELEKKTKELNDEVDQLKKSTDLSSEATETLKKKEEKLKKAKEELNKATDEMNKANNTRLDLIKQINDKYSTYLGYMLSEKTAAEEVATAHQLIISALKEEMAQKRMLRSQEAIENEFGEDITKWRQNSREELDGGALKGHKDLQQQVMERWESVMARISYDTKKGVFTIPAIEGINGQAITKRTVEELRPIMQQLLSNTMTKVAEDAGVDRSFYFGQAGTATDKAQTSWGGTYGSWSTDDGFARWTEATLLREQRIQQQHAIDNAGLEGAHTQTVEDAKANMIQNRDNLLELVESNQTFTEEQIRKMAQNVNAVVAGFNKYGKDLEESSFELVFGKDKEATLENAVTTMLAGVGEDVRKRVLKTAKAAATSPNGTGSVNTTTTNPWGTSERADSTTYTEMTAEQLVNRREQMNKFVNSLQTDTDVKAVLNEDKALKKAIEAGMSSDMRTVIEWYNTERLKIQDELHARHLTNTGDWLDPKKERGAKKQFRDEMDAYLHELDAYYTERKTRIEQARNDEEITEGEAWRRTIQNDNEWQTRRAELQKLYSRKQQEVTQEELDAIIRIIAERTGDSESFVKAAIAKTNQFVDAIEKSGDKGAAIVHRWMSQVVLDTERSYLKAAQAIGKQMKFIEETLAKERPYDGITKNLQDNLDKMGVLAAKYRRENEELARQGKEPKYSNEQITAQSYDEMAFYLRQAADAYSIDIDELLRRMVKEGMTATAEEISKSDMLKQAVMGQLRKTYQEVQDAIKKEASQIKKDVEIIWNDDARGIGGMSMKATFDKALAQLGMQQDSVSRANSLIGAGAASDNVASRLAIKQIEVQMRMQKAQYDMYRVQANQRMAALKAEAKEHQRIAELEKQAGHEAAAAEQRTKAMVALRDAENVRLSLGLTLAEETKKEEQQKAELLKIQEESQNRLYTSLREWADLLTSSLQGVMEASHAGDAEYYNERAKLELTGKGGPGAGTYVVIDDAGTSDATAHYEYLDERQALERQHEIEIQNAQAEAWKKLWDDINMKMSEQITDWMNAYLQSKATEDNTAELQRLQQKLEAEQQKMDASVTATDANTQAVQGLTQQLADGIIVKQDGNNGGNAPGTDDVSDFAYGKQNLAGGPQPETLPSGGTDDVSAFAYGKQNYAGGPATAATDPANTSATEANTQAVIGLTQVLSTTGGGMGETPEEFANGKQNYAGGGELSPAAQQQINEQNAVTENFISNKQKEVTTETQTSKKIASTNASTFAKMTQAVNLYGIAYQAMSNDNLSTEQKFQMIALQAAGQAAIAGLTATASASTATVAAQEGAVASRTFLELGPIAGPIALAALTAIIGGLMGMAVSKIAKGKSEIAQATGASVGAGRLATGMLTYAEGNVNELTDPASLTPGRQYNVDGADGKTYRARYMGKGAKTHITNGPEFHLVGEAGREAIIDAKTTRLLQLNETGIWRDIQTLYNGGSISGLSTRRRRGNGMAAFADGNIGEFEDMADGGGLTAEGTGGMGMEQMLTALDRNSAIQEALLERLNQPIYAQNILYGPEGLPNVIAKLQKEAQRHGEKYL